MGIKYGNMPKFELPLICGLLAVEVPAAIPWPQGKRIWDAWTGLCVIRCGLSCPALIGMKASRREITNIEWEKNTRFVNLHNRRISIYEKCLKRSTNQSVEPYQTCHYHSSHYHVRQLLLLLKWLLVYYHQSVGHKLERMSTRWSIFAWWFEQGILVPIVWHENFLWEGYLITFGCIIYSFNTYLIIYRSLKWTVQSCRVKTYSRNFNFNLHIKNVDCFVVYWICIFSS